MNDVGVHDTHLFLFTTYRVMNYKSEFEHNFHKSNEKNEIENTKREKNSNELHYLLSICSVNFSSFIIGLLFIFGKKGAWLYNGP